MATDIDGNKVKAGDKMTLPDGNVEHYIMKTFLGNYIQFFYSDKPVLASKYRLVSQNKALENEKQTK